MKMKKAFSLILCAALLFAVSLSAVIAVRAEDEGKICFFDFYVYFSPWQGEGDAEAIITHYDENDFDRYLKPKDFLSLKSKSGDEIDPAYYTIEQRDGKTVLRLKEEYLRTLDDGFYWYTADFRHIMIDAKLAIAKEQKDGGHIVIPFPAYSGGSGATVYLYSEDGTRFSWNMLQSLRLGDRELTRDEFFIGEWAGTVRITLYQELLDTLPFGEYRLTADFMNVKNVTLLLTIENPRRIGDADGNGRITASDARLALQMAARIETQTGMDAVAADIDRTGAVETADARQILRVAARLDIFRVEVDSRISRDQAEPDAYMIDALRAGATQYRWKYAVEPAEGLTVTEQTVNRSAPGEVGLADAQRFLVSANKPGDYTLRLVQKTDWKEEWIDEIEFVFHVKDIDKF